MKNPPFQLRVLFVFDWRLVATTALPISALALRHLLG
jgi:hypothetical protein